MKSIIGLDLDGVIIDHTKNKLVLAKRFGVTIADPKETASDIYRTKFADDTYEEIQRLLFDDPKIAEKAELIKGAREGMSALAHAGYALVLISRRKSDVMPMVLLKKFGLWNKYFDQNNTFFVRSKKDKDIKAAALGVKTYMDDQPSVLEVLTSVPHKFLYDPLFAHEPNKLQFKRVASWPEFLKQLT